MTASFTLLDGGMGRLLQQLGAPFRLPEWSALSLIEAPGYVRAAHRAYAEAGADILTTNTYGLAPHMIGEARFWRDARALADLAGRLAREVADEAGRGVRVAGSLPPSSESYRPELYDAQAAGPRLRELVAGLAPHVDFWLIETQSSTREALAALATTGRSKPVFVSYTLRDEDGRRGPPELRSREPVSDAVAATLAAGADGVLFNCSQPEAMQEAVTAARKTIDASGRREVRLGVYANAFLPEPPSDEPYAGISILREDLGPEPYLRWVRRWLNEGADIVGGCCGIGPDHIAEIARFRGESPSAPSRVATRNSLG